MPHCWERGRKQKNHTWSGTSRNTKLGFGFGSCHYNYRDGPCLPHMAWLLRIASENDNNTWRAGHRFRIPSHRAKEFSQYFGFQTGTPMLLNSEMLPRQRFRAKEHIPATVDQNLRAQNGDGFFTSMRSSSKYLWSWTGRCSDCRNLFFKWWSFCGWKTPLPSSSIHMILSIKFK